MPKISVVMPVYNTDEKYFREAIQSILNQSFSDLELIIVDDCSKPYIKEIAGSYSDKRIKYYRLDKNQGAANARNFAISKACGKYLAFMDSDDVSISNRLQAQYDFLVQHPEIGCLGTKTEVIDSVNEKNKKIKFPNLLQHKEIEEFLLSSGCAFCQSSVMLLKKILDENNIRYKSEYVPAEDYAFWLDLIGHTKFAILDKVLVKYRFYAENISNRQTNIQRQKCIDAQLNAIERYCGITLKDTALLKPLFSGDELSLEKLEDMFLPLNAMIIAMRTRGFSKKTIRSTYGRKFKRLYYHTHSLKGQWQILKSPLNRIFNIPLSSRIFYLITRGVF